MERTKWGDATPAAMLATAVVMLANFAVLSGLVETSSGILVGVWLIGAGLVQLVASLINLREGNSLTGNIQLFYAMVLMIIPGILWIVKFWIATAGLAVDLRADGYVWFVLVAATVVLIPIQWKTHKLLGFTFILWAVAFACIMLLELSIIPIYAALIVAIAFLIAGFISIYLAALMLLGMAKRLTIEKETLS
jgi:hypothetical protein